MPRLGDRIPDYMLEGRHHGVLVAHHGDSLWSTGTRTRRGARRAFLDTIDWLTTNPHRANARPGETVLLIRAEADRVADVREIHIPDDPPPISVREPRPPSPAADGAATADE